MEGTDGNISSCPIPRPFLFGLRTGFWYKIASVNRIPVLQKISYKPRNLMILSLFHLQYSVNLDENKEGHIGIYYMLKLAFARLAVVHFAKNKEAPLSLS